MAIPRPRRAHVALVLLVLVAAASPGCNGRQIEQPALSAPPPQPEPARKTGEPQFLGVGGKSDTLVYVVDRSGSMTDSIMYVKYELKRSIRMLKPNQHFHVIFYSTGPAVEMPPRKLVPATENNKLAAYEFIDSIVPVGQTDPAAALKAAFRDHPDIIYFLTDGEFDRKIPGLVRRLNVDKKVRVNTFCFIYTGSQQMMQQIAEENGGSYKYIGEDDLESLGR